MKTARTELGRFRISGWGAIVCSVFFALAILIPIESAAQPTFNVIYNFTGGSDGAQPHGLTMDATGKLYGTALLGGIGCEGVGCGTVYQLIHNASGWHFNRLYAFSGSDGQYPDGRVLFGPGGALYGTTYLGGNGNGNVFSLIPPPEPPRTIQENHWIETVLYSFTGGGMYPDGPNGDLAFDRAGDVYGATYNGGSYGDGAVFKLTRSGNSWSESVLYSFTDGGDGAGPNGVTLQAGDLYGTTDYGGTLGNGAVFQLTPSGSGWAENSLHDFQNGNGEGRPGSDVFFDGAGNMYGSTFGYNGSSYGPGTIWELMPSGGSWTFSTLYNFSAPGCGNPAGPEDAPLTMDQAGNLYGTTLSDGAHCWGSVFKLSPSGGGQWTYTSLHDFTGGNDGGAPFSNVIIDTNGNLYGSAAYGGPNGHGVVWEITP